MARVYAPVAQRIRAFVFGTKGRTFESYRVYQRKESSQATLFSLVISRTIKQQSERKLYDLRRHYGIIYKIPPSMKDVTPIGRQFIDMLRHADAVVAKRDQARKHAEKIHIVGAGRTLTAAYEQLRNAAEYTEEHLLLQRAIRRFYKRLFLVRDAKRASESGEELAVELTFAGYLANDSVTHAQLSDINTLAAQYFAAYEQLVREGNVAHADAWVIDTLAVRVENVFADHSKRAAFAQFAYRYFSDVIPPTDSTENRDTCIFIAVHRQLLKSDNATIRSALLERYQVGPEQIEQFTQLNMHLDKLLLTSAADKVARIVNRRGAALRVLWRMVDEVPDIADILSDKNKFMAAYETQITDEYRQLNTKINRGIVKSVIFLIITKFLIGIGLEVPYDYIMHGEILWVPLVVNLLFPPLFMILLRLTLVLPTRVNTNALMDQMESLLYLSDRPVITVSATAKSQNPYPVAFNVLYACLFVLVFGGVAWGLWSIGFSALHLIIFFLFLSTASFLGFRLSRLVREVETIDAEQNGIALMRDFLYLPFVVVGRWISEKYSKVNIVALVLDMLIELPLKTVLRLIQQWSRFISTKKDEL